MSGAGENKGKRLRLGGMAFRNGLLISGPTSWALAVRRSDGEIDVASGKRPVLARGVAAKVPFLRGPLRLFEALLVLPLARIRVRSSRLAFEDPAVFASIGLGLVANRLTKRISSSATKEIALAAIAAAPALVSLRDRDLAAYHGAEHMAIGAYENGSDDPATAPKEHRRCGSNLMLPIMALSALAQGIVAIAFKNPGPVHRTAASLLATGTAVELFAYADRNPDSTAASLVHGPGMAIQQYISTAQPDADQIEVARTTLQAILAAEAA